MKRRLIAGALLLALVISGTPVGASAVNSKAQSIKNQIATVYSKSLRRMGKRSFLGFCGQAVNNQLYYLGIDTKVRGCNGKDEFDQYKKLGTTTGGYPCRAYPASRYTLRGALDAISENGTRDVYNILVGFQSTTTSEAGKKFGHTVLIHAILDGIVYFAECCSVMVDGKYCPEGCAITCSIEAFSNYYDSWATLDGLIWFGNKSNSEQCRSYDAGLDAMALRNVPLYSRLPDPEEYDPSECLETVYAGQILSVIGILETPQGEYWYEVEHNGSWAYVEAAAFKTLQVTAGELSVGWENVHMPSYLRRGQVFVLGGEIYAGNGSFRKLEVTVRESSAPDTAAPIYSAEMEMVAKSVRLSEVTDGAILWRDLPEGEYILTICATVESRVVEEGSLSRVFQKQELWRSEFRVVRGGWFPEISFDACGGDTQLERTVTDRGGTLDTLPRAQRSGYTFLGWYTQPEGGEPITTETEFTGNCIVYAHWEPGDPAYTGWLQTDGRWIYYREGEPVYSWFFYNGLRFWQDNLGYVPNGWRQIRGQWYHFSGAGAVNSGWLETERGISYMRFDGEMTTGRITIAGKEWIFDESGILVLH